MLLERVTSLLKRIATLPERVTTLPERVTTLGGLGQDILYTFVRLEWSGAPCSGV